MLPILSVWYDWTHINQCNGFDFDSNEAAADTSAKEAHLSADLECKLGLVPHQVRLLFVLIDNVVMSIYLIY